MSRVLPGATPIPLRNFIVYASVGRSTADSPHLDFLKLLFCCWWCHWSFISIVGVERKTIENLCNLQEEQRSFVALLKHYPTFTFGVQPIGKLMVMLLRHQLYEPE